MDTRRLGIERIARSDWGHTTLLVQALRCRVLETRQDWEQIDALLIPTDRWEMGMAACTALGAGLPIVQLHAGESTPHCFDDEVRHFISRVAALRFVCHDVHRQRLLSMGIPDDTIHVCGAPGLDKLRLERLPRELLGELLGLHPDRKWAIVIQHPTTRTVVDAEAEMRACAEAIGDRDAIWFTPCYDPGREPYVRPGQRASVTDVQWRSLLWEADVLIGNSSAIVTEAPFVGLKTIEIGVRQQGRDRVPYGDGHSVPRIVQALREWEP